MLPPDQFASPDKEYLYNSILLPQIKAFIHGKDVYKRQGNQIRKLAAPDSNRLPVTLDQIPVDLQHAVVAIEDERFYEHNGIDVKGILRADVYKRQPKSHAPRHLVFIVYGVDYQRI